MDRNALPVVSGNLGNVVVCYKKYTPVQSRALKESRTVCDKLWKFVHLT